MNELNVVKVTLYAVVPKGTGARLLAEKADAEMVAHVLGDEYEVREVEVPIELEFEEVDL